MVRLGELNRLIEDAYGAALDEELWAPWSERLIEHFGGVGGAFVVVDMQSSSPRFFQHHRANEKAVEDYWGGMMQFDPQLRYSATLNGSGLYLDTDHVDLTDPNTAEYMRWQDAVPGWRHHMTCYASLGDGRYKAGLSVSRASSDGPTPTDEQKRLSSILPHVARAMQLGFCHAEKLDEAYWNGLCQAGTEASMLLDEQGRMLRSNTAMEKIVAASLGFDIVGGRPQAANAAEDARLRALIDMTTRPHEPRSGALSIMRGAGRSRLLLTIYPLPRRHRMLAPAEAAALLTIVDPLAAPRPRPEIYREAIGLTLRQAELASLLMMGHSIESAANDLGIRLPTARLHLHRILDKAQVSRQIDLVRLLSRL